MTYEADGYYRTHVTDEMGRESYVETDGVGRLVTKEEIADRATRRKVITTFKYNPQGNLRTVAKGPNADVDVTTIGYDVLGRRSSLKTPDTRVSVTTINAFGEVVGTDDLTGRRSTIVPDALGRPVRRTDGGGGNPETVTTFDYDVAPFGIGGLARATSPDGVRTVLSYHPKFGVPRLKETYVPGQNGGQPFAVETTFDDFGRPDRLLYPETPGTMPRFAVQHVYGAANGGLSQVKHAATGAVYWEATGRDPLGRISGERYDDGAVTSTRTYAKRTGRLETMVTERGGSRLQDLTYLYNPDGAVRGRQDRVSGGFEGFTYDELDRLKRWYATDIAGNDISAQAWSVDWVPRDDALQALANEARDRAVSLLETEFSRLYGRDRL